MLIFSDYRSFQGKPQPTVFKGGGTENHTCGSAASGSGYDTVFKCVYAVCADAQKLADIADTVIVFGGGTAVFADIQFAAALFKEGQQLITEFNVRDVLQIFFTVTHIGVCVCLMHDRSRGDSCTAD